MLISSVLHDLGYDLHTLDFVGSISCIRVL
jgi:hypothetical protein